MLVVEPVCNVKHALKTLKMIATSGFLTALECTKFVFGRGTAPDPAGEAHDASPDPLVGWGGDTPSPFPNLLTPSASRSRRLRRLDLAPSARGRQPPSNLNFPLPMLGGLDKTLLKSLHSVAFGFFSNGMITVCRKSAGHFPLS